MKTQSSPSNSDDEQSFVQAGEEEGIPEKECKATDGNSSMDESPTDAQKEQSDHGADEYPLPGFLG